LPKWRTILLLNDTPTRHCHDSIVFPYYFIPITRRPKEPWIAHLKKRSKVTVKPFTKDPRAGCQPGVCPKYRGDIGLFLQEI